MTNIVVVDDHPLLREGVKKVVQKSIDMKVTDVASDWRELYSILEKGLPDIIILDITMPGKSGLDILKDLHEIYPQVPVLILTIHSEKRFAVRALKAGAKGYINKATITDELVKAIRKIVTEKRKYISSEVSELLAERIDSNSTSKLHENLTDREFQVMCGIAAGKGVKEIAREFSLSPRTVYSYRANIKQKMNLDSNSEMTRYAINNNLIE